MEETMAWKLVLIGACALTLAGSAPLAAFADDPTASPDHSGKQVDGKTNGISPSTAQTIKEQQKEQPAVKGEAGAGGAVTPQK
jgi:hypothetical protein